MAAFIGVLLLGILQGIVLAALFAGSQMLADSSENLQARALV
jgi:hypothetical protein